MDHRRHGFATSIKRDPHYRVPAIARNRRRVSECGDAVREPAATREKPSDIFERSRDRVSIRLIESEPEFITRLFVKAGRPAEQPARGEVQRAQLVIEVINPRFVRGAADIIRMPVDAASQAPKAGHDIGDRYSRSRYQGFAAAPRFDEIRIVLGQR